MEQFLKQFSTLPHEFISDFFIIAKEEYVDNEIIIDFINVCKWLKVNKSDLKRVLIKNFDEKFDYTITKIKKKLINSNGATIYNKILITPNCLKGLCMISQTSKAKEVRKYFIEMEKLIKKYFNTIKKDMYKKIGILENNQKSKINPTKGVIYIIETTDGIGHYKIGKTKNLKKRLTDYNKDKKDDIIPIFIYETDDIDEVEKCVKLYAKKYQYRKYKEVYKTDVNMLKELINECDNFGKKVNLKMKWKPNNKNINKNHYIAVYKH